jgi:hypothetical protein
MANHDVMVELFGEGKSDIGKEEGVAVRPVFGVLMRLLHTLCGAPPNMLVKRYPVPFLHGKGWAKKVQFAKRQAYYNKSDGAVFVLDTEGEQKARMGELAEGRDSELPKFPMAVGAPHPCIEVWLLADPAAIVKGMKLSDRPQIPDELEALPAPCKDRKRNPKVILAQCGGSKKSELTAAEKDRIAAEIRVLQRLRDRCPTSFAPFAEEVEKHILPLFSPLGDAGPPTDAGAGENPA